jgi:alkylation response protein AidB-like acyl-CoA dehydrogenase
MTFAFQTPAEREATAEFREEVRAWLDAHIPADLELPKRGQPVPPAIQEWAVKFRRALGEKGWLASGWPKEYGGGGLTPVHSAIIQDELERQPLPPIHGSLHILPAIRVWGTEEQKRRFLRPILSGEMTAVHMFTEASVGSDMLSPGTRAVRDGDDYVVDGQKDFITSRLKIDLMFTLALTNPTARRDRRLSILAIDAASEGVIIKPANLLVGGSEQTVYLNAVRVPVDRLIGEEGQGASFAEMVLEVERGGMGITIEQQREVEWREKQAREPIQN